MKVFLDAKDLIDVLEYGKPCSLDDLRESFERGGHQLALTPIVVFEIARPLTTPKSHTNVMRILSRLEQFPISYLALPRIAPMEYRQALRDFEAGREFSGIDPYVDRFDRTLPTQGLVPTDDYLRHGLAETVWTLWHESPEVFEWGTPRVQRLKAQFESDRALPNPPSLKVNFRKKVELDLRLYRIRTSLGNVEEFSDWVYESPSRCPTGRLNYEVYHQIRRNIADLGHASDFGDMAHLACLPYVDAMTLDRRMVNYVKSAVRGWPSALDSRIERDTAGILSRFERSNSSSRGAEECRNPI